MKIGNTYSSYKSPTWPSDTFPLLQNAKRLSSLIYARQFNKLCSAVYTAQKRANLLKDSQNTFRNVSIKLYREGVNIGSPPIKESGTITTEYFWGVKNYTESHSKYQCYGSEWRDSPENVSGPLWLRNNPRNGTSTSVSSGNNNVDLPLQKTPWLPRRADAVDVNPGVPSRADDIGLKRCIIASGRSNFWATQRVADRRIYRNTPPSLTGAAGNGKTKMGVGARFISAGIFVPTNSSFAAATWSPNYAAYTAYPSSGKYMAHILVIAKKSTTPANNVPGAI